jgi:integral membrane sensor domain MASE1
MSKARFIKLAKYITLKVCITVLTVGTVHAQSQLPTRTLSYWHPNVILAVSLANPLAIAPECHSMRVLGIVSDAHPAIVPAIQPVKIGR